MMKKIVQYIASAPYTDIQVGKSAFVFPLDHPDSLNVSNTKYVLTSRVLIHDLITGEFETMNSRYVPAVVQ